MDSNLVVIANGPSKFDLMLALFDSKFPDFRTVVFHLRDGRKFEANITSVQAEDGSGGSWNFTATGHLSSDDAHKFVHVGGYYSTTSREGSIKFPESKSTVSPELRRLDEAVRQGNIAICGDSRQVRR